MLRSLLVVTISFAMIFSSCTITKRKYRKGYNIEAFPSNKKVNKQEQETDKDVAENSAPKEPAKEVAPPNNTKKDNDKKGIRLPGFFPFDQAYRMGFELGFRENAGFSMEINSTYRSVGLYYYQCMTSETPFYSLGLLWNFYEHKRHAVSAGISIEGNPILAYNYTFSSSDYIEYYLSCKTLYSIKNPPKTAPEYKSFGTDHFIPLSFMVGMRIPLE